MPEEKKEEKKDYLKIARLVFDAGKTYTSEEDKERSQNAQASALIAIAEELRRLNENLKLARRDKEKFASSIHDVLNYDK
jgi:hypothetical protein